MAGVNLSLVQPNGVTTGFATILDIRWQPGVHADLRIGYFLDESIYTLGGQPVHTEYFILDISQIDPTQPIPPQIFAQITASGAPLYGGTLVS